MSVRGLASEVALGWDELRMGFFDPSRVTLLRRFSRKMKDTMTCQGETKDHNGMS